MAKNIQQQNELYQLFGVYNIRLGKLYSKFVKELSSLGYDTSVLEDNPLFNFDNFPELRERLNAVFYDFVQKNMLTMQDGIKAGTALAFSQDASNLKGYTIFNDDAINRVRAIATRSFLASRLGSEHGLSLSDKVWNYAQHSKTEFEMAISNVITDGLKHGISAEELSRKVRQQLNDPDMMYRRYHLKVLQSDGSKKDVAVWYRRIIGPDGKVHFVQVPLEEVGTGTYRSARKNAVRLMRTEINASYHNANAERWRLEPFVLGIRIWGSPEHPRPDICDELWGDYPKEIDFAGFHPQCLCASAPILCSEEERDEIIRRKMNGEDISKYVSPNRIKDMPKNFKDYIDAHHDSIKGQFERGTASWFFRDNTRFFAGQFSESERASMGIMLPPQKTKHIKTDAEKKLIQQRWDERKKQNALTTKTYENVLKVASQYPEVNTSLLQQLAGKYDLTQLRIETKNVARQIIDARKFQELAKKTALNVIKVAGGYSEVSTANILSLYNAKDFVAMSAEAKAVAKQIAALNKQAKARSDVIPNAKGYLSQFSSKELQEVKNAVQGNITKWQDKYATDAYLQKKYKSVEEYVLYRLGEKAKYVVDPTYLKAHTLYPTSKVAEAAYLNQATIVQHGIDMKAISAEIAEVKQWSLAHPQSKNVAKLLNEAESLFAADNDMAALKQKVADAKAEVEKREKEQARRDRKKLAKGGQLTEFDLPNISKKEALQMIADFEKEYGEKMDILLRSQTEKMWSLLTPEERLVVTKYTQTYNYLNEPLTERMHYSRSYKEFEHDMPILTKALSKVAMPENVVIRRGVDDYTINALGKYLSEVKPGDEFVNGSFLSTAVRTDKGFFDELNLVIVVPKGAQGIYAEPFSHYTDSFKFDFGTNDLWNGVSREAMGREREWIGQRGAKFRVLDKKGKTIYLQMIGQLYNQTTDYLRYFP